MSATNCLFCGSEIDRGQDVATALWVHIFNGEAHCGYGDGTVAVPASAEDRIAELRAEWAAANGENPDDYQLSGDDWVTGLGEDGAKEMAVLLAMTEQRQ